MNLYARCLPLALACALCACRSVAPGPSDTHSMLTRIDAVVSRLDEIEAALGATLRKRTVLLRVNALAQHGKPILPSQLLAQMPAVDHSVLGAAFFALLDDVGSGNEIARSYGCSRWNDGPAQSVARVFGERQREAAAYLDAVVRVQITGCVPTGLAINTTSASLPSDSNSKAQKSTFDKAADAAMNLPLQVTEGEMHFVMLGQAFRFGNVDDDKIPLAAYLQRQVQSNVQAVQRLILQTRPDASPLTVKFDRNSTSVAESMQRDPRGWFNAEAQANARTLYISPTVPRAALVFCAVSRHYRLSLNENLKKNVRPELLKRASTADDVAATVAAAEKSADRMAQCLADEMFFLLAHELSHGMLKIGSEAIADCSARALGASVGRENLGLFASLIFPVANSQDFYRLLGLSAAGREALLCRERSLQQTKALLMTPFATSFPACLAMNDPCP
ncbi:hypothetical protein [Janthinobacterium sp. MDB2-8]|uniref:hypothetical protein n=1 Tax=Janthinobacterium sp. MDB2-8 TaxID=1259338 RepID=UPI003F275FB1